MSQRCILNDSCPIDPCETPYSMSYQELNVSLFFTLCLLLDKKSRTRFNESVCKRYGSSFAMKKSCGIHQGL